MADAIWRLASPTPSRAGLMTDEMEMMTGSAKLWCPTGLLRVST